MNFRRRAMLAGLASLPVALAPRKPHAQDPSSQDQDAPAFVLGRLQLADPPRLIGPLRWTDAAGKPRELAGYAGTGLVLNFWATWCAPCVTEMPSLAVLAAQLAGQGVLVLPIAGDTGGASAVQRFYAAKRIDTLGIWLDPANQAMQAVHAVGLPTTLIVDRRGRETARIAGAADWSTSGTRDTIVALCNE